MKKSTKKNKKIEEKRIKKHAVYSKKWVIRRQKNKQKREKKG